MEEFASPYPVALEFARQLRASTPKRGEGEVEIWFTDAACGSGVEALAVAEVFGEGSCVVDAFNGKKDLGPLRYMRDELEMIVKRGKRYMEMIPEESSSAAAAAICASHIPKAVESETSYMNLSYSERKKTSPPAITHPMDVLFIDPLWPGAAANLTDEYTVLSIRMVDFVVSAILAYRATMRMMICRVCVDWESCVEGYGESFRKKLKEFAWSMEEFMPKYILREESGERVSYATGRVKYLIIFPKK